MVPVEEAVGTAARLFLAWLHYHSDTAGCLAAGCRRPPPPARPQARPASHEPLRPPAPSPGRRAATARRPRAVWGTETSGSEKPRLAEAPVFPSRAHEVGKDAQGRAQARLPPAAGLSPGPASSSMSRVSPVLESGLMAPTSCSAPRGPRKGGPGKGMGQGEGRPEQVARL